MSAVQAAPLGVQVSAVTEVTEHVVAAWQKLIRQLSDNAEPPSRQWLEEVIHSDSILYAAWLDGRIVGFLTLVLCRIPVGLKAWIEDVVVDEGLRGQRIGELLTLAAIERAREANARNVNLESRPSREAAHRLYKRVGFQERETVVYRYQKS